MRGEARPTLNDAGRSLDDRCCTFGPLVLRVKPIRHGNAAVARIKARMTKGTRASPAFPCIADALPAWHGGPWRRSPTSLRQASAPSKRGRGGSPGGWTRRPAGCRPSESPGRTGLRISRSATPIASSLRARDRARAAADGRPRRASLLDILLRHILFGLRLGAGPPRRRRGPAAQDVRKADRAPGGAVAAMGRPGSRGSPANPAAAPVQGPVEGSARLSRHPGLDPGSARAFAAWA